MSEIIKKFSLADVQMYRNDEDVDFAEVEIWALSEGNNSHNNPFSKEVLERDSDTFKGKLIIAKYDKWSNDTTTHVPDQSILGYIDPRVDVEFKTKEVDGVEKEFVVVHGLLSKIYATDVVEMFRKNNERTVSCEFSCELEYDEDENGIPINELGEKMPNTENRILSYHIHGITILGLRYNPSVKGTEIKVKKFAEDFNKNSLRIFAEKRKKDLNKDNFDREEKMAKSKEFAVNIGNLWSMVYCYLEEKYPDDDYGSIYRIQGIYEENSQKFAVVYKKEDSKMYKINFNVTNDSIEMAEDLVETDMVFVDKEGTKSFSDDTVDNKYKVFEEKEKEEKEVIMEEEKDKKDEDKEEKKEKEMSEDDDNDKSDDDDKEDDEDDDDDEKDEKEKKFSLDAYADSGAVLSMLEKETDENKELAKKVMSEMSAEEILTIVLSFAKENKELREFKENKLKEDKTIKLSQIMANVKEDLDTKTFGELQKEGESLSFDELGAFENKVKAFAYEATKGKMKNFSEDIRMDVNNKQNRVETEDVFTRISRK